jgi:hypothetical protein
VVHRQGREPRHADLYLERHRVFWSVVYCHSSWDEPEQQLPCGTVGEPRRARRECRATMRSPTTVSAEGIFGRYRPNRPNGPNCPTPTHRLWRRSVA